VVRGWAPRGARPGRGSDRRACRSAGPTVVAGWVAPGACPTVATLPDDQRGNQVSERQSTSTFLLAAGNLAGPPDDVERRHADVVRTATQAGLPPAGNLRVTGWPVAVLVTPSHGGDA
jgi:hypothetical protein